MTSRRSWRSWHQHPYDQDGYTGELTLDHTTLKTEAAGYTTKHSSITELKSLETWTATI